MKKLSLIYVLYLVFVSGVAQAQITDCDLFCVTEIQMDSVDSNLLNVTIFNAASDGTWLNYPYIDFVLDSNGDTVANGDPFIFFAHLGNASQTYPVPTLLDSLPAGFTGTVFLSYSDLTGTGNDTTCPLSYPCLSTGLNYLTSDNISIYPNPSSSQVTLEINSMGGGEEPWELRIVNLLGQEQYSRRIPNTGNTCQLLLDVSTFSSGIYFLTLSTPGGLLSHKLLIQ